MQEQNNVANKFAYNMYPTFDKEKYMKLKAQMNTTIDTINSMTTEYQIGDELRLDTDSTDPELDKLNALHFFFEQVSIEAGENNRELFLELYPHLEDVNQIVHILERGYEHNQSLYSVIRVWGNLHFRDEMTDDDYMQMDPQFLHGDMFIDYGTVGKDMWAAFSTKDFELIKNKELKQQDTIHAMFSMYLGPDKYDLHTPQEERKNQWCEENNVDEFYPDWREPKYRCGRIRVGKLSEEQRNDPELTEKLITYNCIHHIEVVE